MFLHSFITPTGIETDTDLNFFSSPISGFEAPSQGRQTQNFVNHQKRKPRYMTFVTSGEEFIQKYFMYSKEGISSICCRSVSQSLSGVARPSFLKLWHLQPQFLTDQFIIKNVYLRLSTGLVETRKLDFGLWNAKKLLNKKVRHL